MSSKILNQTITESKDNPHLLGLELELDTKNNEYKKQQTMLWNYTLSTLTA